jgi:hypothetical protein
VEDSTPVGEIFGAKFDIVHVKSSGYWELSTDVGINELYNKCIFEIVKMHNKYMPKVTDHNGNSIFLPVAGGGCTFDFKRTGFYMSSFVAFTSYMSNDREGTEVSYFLYRISMSTYD